MSGKTFSRITAVVPREIKKSILDGLFHNGVQQVTVTTARCPLLEERKGLGLLLGASSFTSSPVEILSFFVPEDQELSAICHVIKSGNLDVPGRGSVYAEKMSVVDSHPLCQPEGASFESVSDSKVQIFEDLVQISCIVQRGNADEIARILLSRGMVPTITFGEGTGIRDKLGLLRITIPKEKEVVSVVVGKYDAEYFLETMIVAGKLDLPGKGFVSLSPVSRGLINAKSISGASGHAASLEQIIAVIDKMEGGMAWRQDAENNTIKTNRTYLSGMDVYLSTDNGKSLEIAQKAMEAGVSGATISQTALVAQKDGLSPAREICKMMIPSDISDKVLGACRDAGAFDDKSHGIYFTTPVPRAFTYLGKPKDT